MSAENFRAMWLHQRLQVLGPVAWELIDWELTPSEADMLTEQLLELSRYQNERPTDG